MARMIWLVLGLCAVPLRAAELYHLDPLETRVQFDVERFGILWVSARFPQFSGDFVFDRTGHESRIDVQVEVASLDCHDPSWNVRLRSPEWLDAPTYPTMIYRSSDVHFDSSDRATAYGFLTLHGITRPTVLHVSELKCGSGAAAAICSFVAHGNIRRSEYGLPHGIWLGGDQVNIVLSGAGRRADGSGRIDRPQT